MNESFLVRLFNVLPQGLKRHKLIQWAIRLFPCAKLVTIRFNQSALVVADLADSAARQTLITKSFEPEFFTIANFFLIPRGAVVDVGANNGFCTFGLVASLTSGENISFHLFEANKHLCEIIKLSAQLYPSESISVNNGCVTDQTGTSTLLIDVNHWGGSYITQESLGQKIENIILDDYLCGKQIPLVSFLKMDIEGYEIHALKGLEASIVMGKIGAMYIECSSENLRRQGTDALALIELLRGLGCRLFWCKEQDFASGRAQGARELISLTGRGSLRLAPLEDFPPDYQTDIIAIPSAGPHRQLIKAFDSLTC